MTNLRTPPEELQTRKPLYPIFACISVNNYRQTTGFGPLRHICDTIHEKVPSLSS